MRLALSTKYAILALAELARRGGLVSVADLSQAAGVPAPYLAKLVPLLARYGFLVTARGRSGGVGLARPADHIFLKEIVTAVEGPNALQDCPFELAPCSGDPACPLFSVWDPLRDHIVSFLAETSLADVAYFSKKEE